VLAVQWLGLLATAFAMRAAILITGAIFPVLRSITANYSDGSWMATFRYNLVFMQDSG
jgi:hypothetical protein